MKLEIQESINRMSIDDIIDVLYTFDKLSKEDAMFCIHNNKLPKGINKTLLKKYALTDENIAEYVLLF